MITQEERKYLIKSMAYLLNKYDYKFTDDALCKIVDKWATQKADLIEAFKKHPNYVTGKFMIAFTRDYERLGDEEGAKAFSRWLEANALTRLDITPQNILDRRGSCTYLPNDLWECLTNLQWFAERCVSDNTVNCFKYAIPEVRVHVGEKTSRVINKICRYLGYHKIDGYNKAFAKYADSLSPIKIKRHTVLSINPLDYLTMSFGNSWASCHTIDTKNKRNMPNSYQGAYSSGTISYMLDKPSMVFYTVDNSYDGTDYWDQPKINRQMFHWGEEKLVQGRLYPQDNDRSMKQYEEYRNIVQSIMSVIFNFPNLWTFKTGTYEASLYINSYGTHYRDYTAFSNCSLSRIKGSTNERSMDVGETPICVRCGKTHTDPSHIDHCVVIRCSHCGRIIDESEVIEIDGKIYGSCCARRCGICNEYHVESMTYIYNEMINVCDNCLRQHFTRCRKCGKYVRKEKVYEKDGKKVCKRCKNTVEIKFDASDLYESIRYSPRYVSWEEVTRDNSVYDRVLRSFTINNDGITIDYD